MRYLISDVHNNDRHLFQLLDVIGDSNLVFLGDISDSRNKDNPGSFLNVYNTVRPIVDSRKAVLLASNHQENLLSYYDTGKVREGIRATVNEILTLSEDEQENIGQWLAVRPLVFQFESEGITYSCAHAFYDYEGDYENPSDELIQKTIRGPVKAIPGRYRPLRLQWWKNPLKFGHPPGNHIRCVGHYHALFADMHSIVLDPYGDFNNGLGCYDTVDHKFILISNDGVEYR